MKKHAHEFCGVHPVADALAMRLSALKKSSLPMRDGSICISGVTGSGMSTTLRSVPEKLLSHVAYVVASEFPALAPRQSAQLDSLRNWASRTYARGA